MSKNKNSYWKAAALLLFLIGLPLGSWYYLRAGYNYQKQLMEDLRDYGQINNVNLKVENQSRDTMAYQDFHGKFLVATFTSPQAASYSKIRDYQRKIWDQFHDHDSLVILSHSLHSKPLEIIDLGKEHTKDQAQLQYVNSSPSGMKQLLKHYGVPQIEADSRDSIIVQTVQSVPVDYPYFVLVDSKGSIKNYYDVNNHQSVSRLVEHLALVLPRKKREKAVVKRKKEK